MKLHSPVKGEKTKGEMTLAKELIPEMHPWAFPWKGKENYKH
jgi:hypothetical protein